MPVLPHQHQDAVRGGHGDDVEQDGLQRQHERAEGTSEEDERDHHHDPDHQWEVAIDSRNKVCATRSRAAHRGSTGTAGAPHRGAEGVDLIAPRGTVRLEAA